MSYIFIKSVRLELVVLSYGYIYGEKLPQCRNDNQSKNDSCKNESKPHEREETIEGDGEVIERFECDGCYETN